MRTERVVKNVYKDGQLEYTKVIDGNIEKRYNKFRKIFYQRNLETGVESYTDFDENGRRIYYKNSNGLEIWYDGDKELARKNSSDINPKIGDGAGKRCEHIIYQNGDEVWKDYDIKGNLIHYKDTNQLEYWQDFDEIGNCIYRRHSKGFEVWYEYDENGNHINTITSDD